MAKLSGLKDCQMSFGIGRGVAEVQILKNSETGPISWNFLNILIKLCINMHKRGMHKHCYWRELDRGIAKCHLFLMKFCIIIDIDKI